MEQGANEVTWSSGDKLSADTVAKAFGLENKKDLLQRDDVGPFVAAKGAGCGTVILIAVILLIVLIILSDCSGSSGSSYSRSSGGSWGGYSSGGSHK